MGWMKQNVDPQLIDYLFTIKIEDIPNIGVYQRNVSDDLPIDFELLESQLQEVPEQIAFWNMILANQKHKVEVLERRVKTLRGQITDRLLTDARNNKYEVRSTDLKDMINCDPAILQMDAALLKQRKTLNKLEVVVESFIRKFDALRSLSGFKREDKRAHEKA